MSVSTLSWVDGAAAEPVPCTTYSIAGTLNQSGGATAYLHQGDEPLVGHEVFVLIAGPGLDTAPLTLITDRDGRVSLDVPVGADSVMFSAESPITSPCARTWSADPVVIVDQVNRPTSDFPLSSGGMSNPVVPVVVSGPADVGNPGEAGNLAKTGPFSPTLALTALVVVAMGWFARRLRGTPPDHHAGSGRARARVWAGRFARFPL